MKTLIAALALLGFVAVSTTANVALAGTHQGANIGKMLHDTNSTVIGKMRRAHSRTGR